MCASPVVPRVLVLVITFAVLASVEEMTGQEPTFRSRIDLVTVDATVIASDGAPVGTLGPSDFELRIDGRLRPIVSAQFVSQPAPRRHAERLPAPHFTSNQETDAGRVVIIAVDQGHIGRLEGRQALAAGARFIDTLGPADRVGVVGLAQPGALEVGRDRVALKRQLAGLMGQSAPLFQQLNLGLSEVLEIAEGSRARLADAVLRECGRALGDYVNLARSAEDGGAGRDACPEQVEQESRAMAQHAHVQARVSLSALEGLLSALGAIQGPKTLVLLSEGMVADPRRLDLLKLAAVAQASRVAIYVLQLEVPTYEAAQERVSPTLSRDVQVRADGLSRLAGAARGAVFRLVGGDTKPFERIARELSAFYLLAFEASEQERDGRTHRIQVVVPRRGVEVRSRSAFVVPAVSPSPRSRADALVRLLRSATEATELPLRVATYTYIEAHSAKLRVIVSAEADVASGTPGALMGFVVVDRQGVIAATASRDSQDGRHSFSVLVDPGHHTLRVAAIDPLGREGSVERVFEARVATGAGVRLSDLILAPAPKRPEDAFDPVVDHVEGTAIVAYLEVHAEDGRPLADLTASLEVVASAGTSPVLRGSAGVTTDRSWATVRGVIPAGALHAGSYTARVEIFGGATRVGVATRSFTVAP